MVRKISCVRRRFEFQISFEIVIIYIIPLVTMMAMVMTFLLMQIAHIVVVPQHRAFRFTAMPSRRKYRPKPIKTCVLSIDQQTITKHLPYLIIANPAIEIKTIPVTLTRPIFEFHFVESHD